MCHTCLTKLSKGIQTDLDEWKEEVATLDCECCRDFAVTMLDMYQDLKVLNMTKIKMHEKDCPRLCCLETTIKTKLETKLETVLESIEDGKMDMEDREYLRKMDQLKEIHDWMETLEEFQHR